MTEVVAGWLWRCADCGDLTDEPHTSPDGADDLCPDCCVECSTGATYATQEQIVKENRTSMNPGDPIVGHGIPTREQSAAAEAGHP